MGCWPARHPSGGEPMAHVRGRIENAIRLRITMNRCINKEYVRVTDAKTLAGCGNIATDCLSMTHNTPLVVRISTSLSGNLLLPSAAGVDDGVDSHKGRIRRIG